VLRLLERRLSDLAGRERDVPHRHETLRRAIEWSYDLLADEEKHLLRCLSVFAGGCRLEAAEAVAATPGDPGVIEGLIALVEKSLLLERADVDGESRFFTLQTIRDFAAERLEAEGEAAATCGRHLACYLELAQGLGPEVRGAGQAAAIDLLAAEHPNLRRALSWGLEHGEGADAARLAISLIDFWEARGNAGEVRAWYERCLDSVRGKPELEAWLLFASNLAAWRQSDVEVSFGRATAAVELFETLGDHVGVVRALNSLAWYRIETGDTSEGRRLAEHALAIADELGDIWLQALSTAAVAASCEDDSTESALFEKSAGLFEQLGDAFNRAAMLNNAAESALSGGDLERARRLVDESVEAARALRAELVLAFSLATRATVAVTAGRTDDARFDLRQALATVQVHGDWWMVANLLPLVAAVALEDSDADLAARLLGASEALVARFPSRVVPQLLPGLASRLETLIPSGRIEELKAAGAATPPETVVEDAVALLDVATATVRMGSR
jgi:hypothetical protein